jgi:hypothetical protein
VTGTATDARETPDSARYATGTRVLSTGAAADAGNTTLTAGAATGAAVLAAGAAVAVSVTAAARLLVEDHVGGRCADRTGACLSRGHGHDGHRCGHRTTDNKGFQHIEYGHVNFSTPSTHVQNTEFQS